MNKTMLFTMAAILSLGLATPMSYADSHEEKQTEQTEEEREEHYDVKAPETTEEAKALLNEKIEAIQAILTQDEELDPVELENIHEISYALEAAVDKLRADQAENPNIDAMDEAVQALHHGSENGDTENTISWFEKLKTSAANDMAEASKKKPEEKEFYEITIKDHKFTPTELRVPAGKKIKLKVHNQDPTPEEFESDDFRREKIIAGGRTATIFVGPLKPGKYHFFGEFNLDTANGYLIVE